MDREGKRVMQAKAMLEVFPGSNLDQPKTAFWNEPSPSYATWGTRWASQRGWLFLSPSSQHNKEFKCLNTRESNYLTVVISKKEFICSFILEYSLKKKKKKTHILKYIRLSRQRGMVVLHLHWRQSPPPHILVSRPLPLPQSALLCTLPKPNDQHPCGALSMFISKLFPFNTFLAMEVFYQTISIFLPRKIYWQIIIQEAWVISHSI